MCHCITALTSNTLRTRKLKMLTATCCLLSLWLLQCGTPIKCIVNPEQQSANMVIYMRKPNELLPQQWPEGVKCAQQFSKAFFQRRYQLTRAYNLMYTISANLTNPAAYIQDNLLRILHATALTSKSKLDNVRIAIATDTTVISNMTQLLNVILPVDFYIIIVDSVDNLRRLLNFRLRRFFSWRPDSYFFIVYQNAEDYNQDDRLAEEILTEMGKHFAQRVGILYARQKDLYAFIINDYLNSKACRTVRWRTMGECRNGKASPDIKSISLSMQNFFKSYGRKNCTFRVCSTISAPFIEEDGISGIEIDLLYIISQQLQLNISYTYTHMSRGILDANGNWTGLLGKLSDGTCDMVMGGFYPDNEVMQHFWTSHTYLEDSFTWFVKLADRRPPWQALLSIFKPDVWISFGVCLLISWMAWYLFFNLLPEPRHHKELSLAAVNAIAISISVSVNERPTYFTTRLFFFVFALYGLNFMTMYTSRLIVIFKDSGHLHQMKTIEEIAAADIPFGGHTENLDWFDNEHDTWIAEHYNDSELFELKDENLLAVADGSRVILGGRKFMLQSPLSDHIYAFPSNVFSSPLQLFMTLGIPYALDLNRMIWFTTEGGIINKIDNDFYYNHTYLTRISKWRPKFIEEAIILTTDHFQGSFAILVVGCILSTLALIGEIIVYKCKNTKTNIKDNPEKSNESLLGMKEKLVQRKRPLQKRKFVQKIKKKGFKDKRMTREQRTCTADYVVRPWLD